MTRFLILALIALSSCRCGPENVSAQVVSQEVPVDAPETAEKIRPTTCRYVEEGHGEPGSTPLIVDVVADGLDVPWSIDWLSNGDLLVTERSGQLLKLGSERVTLAQVPSLETGEGGLLGLAVHPDFSTTRWIFLYLTTRIGEVIMNRIERWRLDPTLSSASFDSLIMTDIPARRFHNGGRLRFGPDDMLYVGTGDAGNPTISQVVESVAGKLLRLTNAGDIPADNPFPGSAAVLTGIRNVQAFDWLPDGRFVVADHGPSGISNEGGRRGHDEVSVAYPGDNLGWPGPYGCENEQGMITPIASWSQSLPPGGLAVVPSGVIPGWDGDVLIGVLGFGDDVGHLHRLKLDERGNVLISEVYLQGSEGFGRLRDVAIGPDNAIYVTSSGCDGRGSCGNGDVIVRISAG